MPEKKMKMEHRQDEEGRGQLLYVEVLWRWIANAPAVVCLIESEMMLIDSVVVNAEDADSLRMRRDARCARKFEIKNARMLFRMVTEVLVLVNYSI
jgi:hypothetical protein